MRKLLLLAAVAMLGLTGCSRVEPGYVGIKVNLLGSAKGVNGEELGVGRYFIGPNTQLYTFPTFQQNIVWTKNKAEGSENDESITFQTVEGMSCNADIGLAYHLQADKVAEIFGKYRKGIEEITDVYIRNVDRDAINEVSSTLEVEAIYGRGKAAFVDSVENKVQAQLTPDGIIVDKISLIGNIRIPKQVTAALNAKLEAGQRASQRETELREAEAQAAKDVAQAEGQAARDIALANGRATALLTEAKAQAEANRLLARSITPVLVKYELAKKWDGKRSQVVGGSALVDIRD